MIVLVAATIFNLAITAKAQVCRRESNFGSLERMVANCNEIVPSVEHPRCMLDTELSLRGYSRSRISLSGPVARCPQGAGFHPLSSAHPASGIFVGYEGNESFIADLIGILRRQQPQIVLNIVVRRNQEQELRRLLQRVYVGSGMLGPQVNVISVNLANSDETSIQWQQDIMELGMIRSGARSQIGLVEYPYSRAEGVGARIANQCGFDAGESGGSLHAMQILSNLPGMDQSGNWGGNVEMFPGNVLVTGSNINPVLRANFERSANASRPVTSIPVNVDWLSVGHADELFNVVPVPNVPAPCNFAILYSSPAEGLRVARQSESEMPLEPRVPENFRVEEVPVSISNGPVDCISQLPGPNANSPLQAGSVLRCRPMIEANETYERLIQVDLSRLRNAVSTQTGCSRVRTVPLPVIYRPERAGVAGRQPYGSSLDLAVALNPSPVNSLVINNTVIMPQQPNAAFRSTIERRMRALGISPSFINDNVYHFGFGEVHCGTNVVRSCVESP